MEVKDYWIFIRDTSGERKPTIRVRAFLGEEENLVILGIGRKVKEERFLSKKGAELTRFVMGELGISDKNTRWVEYYPEEVSPISGEYWAVNRYWENEQGNRGLVKTQSIRKERIGELLETLTRPSEKRDGKPALGDEWDFSQIGFSEMDSEEEFIVSSLPEVLDEQEGGLE